MRNGPVHFGDNLSSIFKGWAFLKMRSDYLNDHGMTLVLYFDSTRLFVASLLTLATSLLSSTISKFVRMPSSVEAMENALTWRVGCSTSTSRITFVSYTRLKGVSRVVVCGIV